MNKRPKMLTTINSLDKHEGLSTNFAIDNKLKACTSDFDRDKLPQNDWSMS